MEPGFGFTCGIDVKAFLRCGLGSRGGRCDKLVGVFVTINGCGCCAADAGFGCASISSSSIEDSLDVVLCDGDGGGWA